MDRLDCNRSCDCFTGSGIADEFVAGYILEQYDNRDLGDQQIKAAIISDRQVSGYYYNAFEQQFVLRNIKTCLITVDEGEQYKNLSQINNKRIMMPARLWPQWRPTVAGTHGA